MAMFGKRVLNVYAAVAGFFFIISGLGKAFDTSAFSYLIYQYGFEYLIILAPFIVIAEVLLGLLLFFQINVRKTALISFVLLVVFTLSFAYANFFKGVNDCGCFGTLIHVNISPLYSFIRNFVLLAITYVLWRKYPAEVYVPVKWKTALISVIVCFTIFVSGYTYRLPNYLTFNSKVHSFQNEHISKTALTEFAETSPDKKYLFFCFSYTCPHCWNSIENLRRYIKDRNTVDSVIVMATGEDKDRLIFEESFKPDFQIKNLAAADMDKLTDSYPTAFYVERDTVKAVIKSVLPAPASLKRFNLKSNSD